MIIGFERSKEALTQHSCYEGQSSKPQPVKLGPSRREKSASLAPNDFAFASGATKSPPI